MMTTPRPMTEVSATTPDVLTFTPKALDAPMAFQFSESEAQETRFAVRQTIGTRYRTAPLTVAATSTTSLRT
jgi:hypothetical protein